MKDELDIVDDDKFMSLLGDGTNDAFQTTSRLTISLAERTSFFVRIPSY